MQRLYVTCVAGSLEAEGLPGYPESLLVEMNLIKSCQSYVALYFQKYRRRKVLNFTRNVNIFYSC